MTEIGNYTIFHRHCSRNISDILFCENKIITNKLPQEGIIIIVLVLCVNKMTLRWRSKQLSIQEN